MIDVVINYDKAKKEYRLYEPTTDTIIITSNLSETFIKLSELLVSTGLIPDGDILNTNLVTYHLDSGTLISMVESNVNLLKRLTQQAPSIFTSAARKFGGVSASNSLLSSSQSSFQKKNDYNNRETDKKSGGNNSTLLKSSGVFSKSSFKSSQKKFG
jgi:hypothetical protein